MKKLLTTITCSIVLTVCALAQECTTVDYVESLMYAGLNLESYECLIKLLEQDDHDGKAYFALAQRYHVVDSDYSSALEMYEKAEYYMAYVDNKKLQVDVCLFRALCFDDLQMYDKESEYLRKAIQLDGTDFLSNLYMAIFYVDRNQDYHKAEKYVNKCLRIATNEKERAQAYNLKISMAIFYIDRNQDCYEAEKYVNKCLEIATNEKERAQAYNLKSSMALKNKQYSEAISYAEKSISENPESEKGYARLAAAYKESGQYDKAADNAILCVKHYIELYERNDDINLAKNIIIEYAKIDYEKAIAKVDEVAGRQEWWIVMKEIMAKSAKRYEDALDILDKEFGIDNHVDVCKEYYNIEMMLGDFASAALHCEQAYHLAPKNYGHLYGQILNLESAGDEDAFFNVIDQAIEEWPNHSFLYYRKGFHQYNRRQYAKAIENLKISHALYSEWIWSILPLAQSYLKIGYKKEADRWFRYIIDSDPRTPGYKECIAFAYYYLGDIDKAIASVDDDDYRNACLYSLIGDKKQALVHLENALEDGFVDFQRIAYDAALDNIKDDDEFKALIEEYNTKLNDRLSYHLTYKNLRP